MSAVFIMDKNAKVKSEWFGKTVIHSQKRFTYEEAEESIRRGFAVLKRDIEQELTLVRKTSTDTNLSAEERQKEKQLLKDLEEIRSRIGKEVWEIESAVES